MVMQLEKPIRDALSASNQSPEMLDRRLVLGPHGQTKCGSGIIETGGIALARYESNDGLELRVFGN